MDFSNGLIKITDRQTTTTPAEEIHTLHLLEVRRLEEIQLRPPINRIMGRWKKERRVNVETILSYSLSKKTVQIKVESFTLVGSAWGRLALFLLKLILK